PRGTGTRTRSEESRGDLELGGADGPLRSPDAFPSHRAQGEHRSGVPGACRTGPHGSHRAPVQRGEQRGGDGGGGGRGMAGLINGVATDFGIRRQLPEKDEGLCRFTWFSDAAYEWTAEEIGPFDYVGPERSILTKAPFVKYLKARLEAVGFKSSEER